MKSDRPVTAPLFFAVALATTADLSIANLGGYPLRSDALLLTLWDAFILSFAVVPILACLRLTRRLPGVGAGIVERTPWTAVLFSAWLPIAVIRLWLMPPPAFVVVLLTLGGLIALGSFERKRSWRGPGWLAVGVVALTGGVILSALTAIHRHPGHWRLADPRDDAVQSVTPDKPNVLVIVLDTLRADHLKFYGYLESTSPWLDGFAESSTVFTNAITSSSYTLPSHASLFTGLYSEAHGAHEVATVDSNADGRQLDFIEEGLRLRPLSDSAVTLAEIFRDAGFETGGISANPVYLDPFFNLDQGFDTYVTVRGIPDKWRPAGFAIGPHLPFIEKLSYSSYLPRRNETKELIGKEVNDLAFDWLERRQDRRFFLFLNFMEPHTHYWVIGEKKGFFPRPDPERGIDKGAIRRKERGLFPEERERLVTAYDAEIRLLDSYLSELFAKLDELKLRDRTLVVIVGDHGESFGEHGHLAHQNGLYQTEVHIPLIVHNPNQNAGRREERLVHIADVAPTILDKLALPRPDPMHGESLFSTERRYPIVTSLGPYMRDFEEHAAYDGSWKVIRNTKGAVELYNLTTDPAELTNLADSDSSRTAELSQRIDAYLRDVKFLFKDDIPEMDPSMLKDLKGLGYLN